MKNKPYKILLSLLLTSFLFPTVLLANDDYDVFDIPDARTYMLGVNIGAPGKGPLVGDYIHYSEKRVLKDEYEEPTTIDLEKSLLDRSREEKRRLEKEAFDSYSGKSVDNEQYSKDELRNLLHSDFKGNRERAKRYIERLMKEKLERDGIFLFPKKDQEIVELSDGVMNFMMEKKHGKSEGKTGGCDDKNDNKEKSKKKKEDKSDGGIKKIKVTGLKGLEKLKKQIDEGRYENKKIYLKVCLGEEGYSIKGVDTYSKERNLIEETNDEGEKQLSYNRLLGKAPQINIINELLRDGKLRSLVFTSKSKWSASLKSEDVKSILQAMEEGKALEVLDFTSQNMYVKGNELGDNIISLLKKDTELRELYLNNQPSQLIGKAIEGIVKKGLKNNNKLKVLGIKYVDLVWKSLDELTKHLTSGKSVLEELYLDYNVLKLEAESIKEILLENRSLKTLSLVHTFITSEDENISDILDGLIENDSLQELNLSFVEATSAKNGKASVNEMKSIAHSNNDDFVYLGNIVTSVYGNRIGIEMVAKIKEMLEKNDSLLRLGYGGFVIKLAKKEGSAKGEKKSKERAEEIKKMAKEIEILLLANNVLHELYHDLKESVKERKNMKEKIILFINEIGIEKCEELLSNSEKRDEIKKCMCKDEEMKRKKPDDEDE